MIVERAICLAALIAAVAMAFLAVRWARSRRWLRSSFAIIGIVVLNGAATLLVGPAMRGYLYRMADPNVTFVECPFKGKSYDSMRAQYRDKAPGGDLFRTFDKDQWNYFRWYDYVTHPRWTLPYLPDERYGPNPALH